MDKVARVMSVSMITNVFLSISKIIAGVFGNSGALIADGVHSFSDLSTDFVAVVGNFLAQKPADEKHPYGHGKIEYVTSIVISLVILGLGFSIIYQSINKEVMIPSMMVLVVSFVTIVAKYVLSTYIINKGNEYKNNILLASGYESRTDVISSIVVFVSVLCMQLSNVFSILKYADMVASIIVGLCIVKIGFEILKDNMSIILEEQETDSDYLQSIRKIILEKNNIRHIDHLMVLKYGSYYKLVAEVSMDPKLSIMKAHEYIHEAENRLREFDSRIVYVTIHINPAQDYELIVANQKDVKKAQEYIKETIAGSLPCTKEIGKYAKDIVQEHLSDCYMIVVEGKKVGMVSFYEIEHNTILLDTLFIEEDYRHCQIGTSILKNLKKENQDKKILLWVYKNNPLAISLYEHLGFHKKEETEERIKMEC